MGAPIDVYDMTNIRLVHFFIVFIYLFIYSFIYSFIYFCNILNGRLNNIIFKTYLFYSYYGMVILFIYLFLTRIPHPTLHKFS